MTETSKRASAITLRAIVIALVLIPINLRWIAEIEIVYFMFPTYFVPYFNTLATVFLLALGNRAIAKPRALKTGEMLTIFVMLNAASGLLSTNFMEVLVFMLPYPARHAGDGPWAQVFTQSVPSSLTVSDPVAVRNFFEGNSSIYLWENARAWLLPSAIWIAFIVVLVGVMLCMTSILRKQWVENERLSFPIVPMYLEMIDQSSSMYRNRMMWIGFAVAGGITLWNGFAYLYPSLPAIHYKPQPLPYLFQAHPWNVLAGTRFGILFSTVAIAFMMPLDLSMSCWLFYVIFCIQRVMFSMYALPATTASGAPNFAGLIFGTYLGVFAVGIWGGRKHIQSVIRMARASVGSQTRDPRDPLTSREAVYGLVIGAVLLGAFAHWVGLASWLVPLFLIVYAVISVAITRIRAEFSFPVHDMHGMGPQNILLMVCGSSILGPRSLSALAILFWFNRVYTSHPMPHQMEALKMGEAVGSDNRRLMKCFMLAIVLGAAMSIWMCLDVLYVRGAASARVNFLPSYLPSEAFGRFNRALNNPSAPDLAQIAGMVAGLFTALGLAAARRVLLFFPFHPLGLAMAPSWAMWFLWMSMLVGSLAKAVTLKFGGLKAYRKAVPWFFGAMLGEFVVGGLWTVAGIFLHVRTYPFFE